MQAIHHNTRNLKEPAGKNSLIIDISENSQYYIVISLQRPVLKNPPQVLDEATSAMDNETEAAIQRSRSLPQVIDHRPSTMCNADCICVMEHGKLVESGTHEQLLEKDGIYSSLWRVQSGLR